MTTQLQALLGPVISRHSKPDVGDPLTDAMVRPSGVLSRASRALARYLPTRRVPMRNSRPLVSFTFDDVPDSALAGAKLLEAHGAKGTFYIAPGLCGRRERHWRVIEPDGIAALHRQGHEIACHTHDHASVQLLSRSALDEQIEKSREALTEICGRPPSRNFAYPYGVASFARKLQLRNVYTSCRGTYEGIESGHADLGHLGAVGLFDRTLCGARLGRLLDETVERNGWLIFVTHDVADPPSWIGCTPGLFELAVVEAQKRGIACLSVEEALREIHG